MKQKIIKEIRRQLGLTQKRLAEESGVTLATVGLWECGLRQPSLLAVRAMELLLEVNRLRQRLGEEAKKAEVGHTQ